MFVDKWRELADVESLCHPDSAVVIAGPDDICVFDEVFPGDVSFVILFSMFLDGSLLQVHGKPPRKSGGRRTDVCISMEASATGLGAVVPIDDVGALEMTVLFLSQLVGVHVVLEDETRCFGGVVVDGQVESLVGVSAVHM